MAAAVASGRQLDPSQKKRSFLSLRRDKSTESKLEKSAPPSSSRNSNYFEAYPNRSESSRPRRPSQFEAPEDSIIPFPSVANIIDDPFKTPRSGRRPTTAPTSTDSTQLPPLRFSGSSSLSHSPPHTPTSSSPFDDLNLTMPRLMAAPVVETTAMDAFVDGMNGGEEDVFSTIDTLRTPRRRRKSSTKGFHHPLYHPPLPTPPPGVKLGVSSPDSDAEDDSSEDMTTRISRPSRPRPAPSRSGSTSTLIPTKSQKPKSSPQKTRPPALTSLSQSNGHKDTANKPSPSSSTETPLDPGLGEAIRRYVAQDASPKTPVPSIYDIIRAHAPDQGKVGHRARLSMSSPGAPPPVPEHPVDAASDIVSRSSMDSVAEEIQQTLRVALNHPAAALQQARAFPPRSPGEERMESYRSESGRGSPSISSFGTSAVPPPSPLAGLSVSLKLDSNHALATFLRSPRLTRLMKLRRHPHQRLQVSFSDLGSSSGKPVVVFLGLGAVRYIMGLYDEMAEALGLRLITIDRWGLGKTDSPGRNVPRGVKEWASVVEEVLDYLNIDRYSILAHSAGAPYAMALANRAPHKVQGPLCLLAPWVGAGEGASGYKWLKYVPTGLIKTAQAAEWKMQAWMLGKPPAINTGIGYSPQQAQCEPEVTPRPSLGDRRKSETGRPSMGSFSDYDDLADFQGQYGSRSTVHDHGEDPSTSGSSATPTTSPPSTRKRTASKSGRFLGVLWKSGDSSKTSTPPKTPPKLKALKSMTSLRGKDAKAVQDNTRSQTTSLPAEIEDDWSTLSFGPSSPMSSGFSTLLEGARGHSRTKRSISLSSRPSIKSSLSRSPSQKTDRRLSSPPPQLGSSFELNPGPSNAALGNALLAASHSEAQRGTHADLLVILNHSQKPWGFSYEDFPLNAKVWYGEKDEKIAEGAVRWLERTMPPGSCEVKTLKGVGHGLLYNGGVVVEALESLKENWTKK